MKSVAVILLAALIIPTTAFAGSSQVHAFIGADQMSVKAKASEVTWSSNLENMKVNDRPIDGSGTFMLRCGDDGKQYVMISVPLDNDVWPSQDEDLRTKADVAAFGGSLKMSGTDLSSTKVSRERVMYVDLGDKVSEFVRHWGSGMSVRVSAKPGSGLNDVSFIVAAPVPDAGNQEKMAKAAALCQMHAQLGPLSGR
ncbi:hypothetical protein QTA58_09570 [Neorhizobium sp. CSC1952]|uniref:hypothetical protein n=1 Tax=Neorhizobium sp. CSC1952 TaxID=2978974 RepID=UPI0025A57E6D|nr:hypothetical protein [Rhizobium sp. CSC1952]WJR68969.1 hypothetical protein QTA58_09570 [Rhizobium sp. CSC1952]